jgi:hypothetical protein
VTLSINATLNRKTFSFYAKLQVSCIFSALFKCMWLKPFPTVTGIMVVYIPASTGITAVHGLTVEIIQDYFLLRHGLGARWSLYV